MKLNEPEIPKLDMTVGESGKAIMILTYTTCQSYNDSDIHLTSKTEPLMAMVLNTEYYNFCVRGPPSLVHCDWSVGRTKWETFKCPELYDSRLMCLWSQAVTNQTLTANIAV